MHTGPMPNSAGEFKKEPNTEERHCSTCKTMTTHFVEEWDSSCRAYTDYRFTCKVCGCQHWVDGPDS